MPAKVISLNRKAKPQKKLGIKSRLAVLAVIFLAVILLFARMRLLDGVFTHDSAIYNLFILFGGFGIAWWLTSGFKRRL